MNCEITRGLQYSNFGDMGRAKYMRVRPKFRRDTTQGELAYKYSRPSALRTLTALERLSRPNAASGRSAEGWLYSQARGLRAFSREAIFTCTRVFRPIRQY